MPNDKEKVIRGLYSFYYGKNERYCIDISHRKECKGFITDVYVRVLYHNDYDSRLFFSDWFWVKFPRIKINSWNSRRKEPLLLHYIKGATVRNGTKLAKWAEYTVNCANERLGLSKYILDRFLKCEDFNCYSRILMLHINTSGYPFSREFLCELDRLITEYVKTKNLHYKVEILRLVKYKMKDKEKPGEEVTLSLTLENINVTLILLQRSRNKAKYEYIHNEQ